MKKITYVFGDGRINKLSKENEYAKDFFLWISYTKSKQ